MPHAKRDASSPPEAYSVRPSGQFEGNDGSWSTFLLSVGNPSQAFRALISTSSFSTWLPKPDGCVYTQDPQFVPSNCSELRGIGLSQGFQSTGFDESNGTFKYIGIDSLEIGDSLSITDAFGSSYNITGDLGLDTVSLQDGAGSTQLSPTSGTPVVGISNWAFLLPSLGIGDGYLQSTTQNTASFVEMLANQSYIPSHSWSYTAGASYRNYLGNLVLGGYDKTRFAANTTTYYSMPPSNQASEMQVSLSSIAFSFANGTEASVPVSQNAVIDSTLPYLYLPSSVCDSLASRLSLTYDDSTDLYTLTAGQVKTNSDEIQQIRITVGDTQNSGNTTSITLPYAAFNLNASWPTYDQNQSQPYFPIRKASGTTYIIGRTFLQEAHVSMDRERGYFNLSQASFPSTQTAADLVSIYNVSTVASGKVPDSKGGSSSSSHSLSRGAIAGIIIAAIAGAALAAALLFWLCIGRKRRAEQQAQKRRSEQEPMIARKLSSIIPPLSPTTPGTSPNTATTFGRDTISPVDGQFLHITRVNELGTESAEEARAGVHVLPGIHEIGGLEKPPPVRGEGLSASTQSSPSNHHSSPMSELEA